MCFTPCAAPARDEEPQACRSLLLQAQPCAGSPQRSAGPSAGNAPPSPALPVCPPHPRRTPAGSRSHRWARQGVLGSFGRSCSGQRERLAERLAEGRQGAGAGPRCSSAAWLAQRLALPSCPLGSLWPRSRRPQQRTTRKSPPARGERACQSREARAESRRWPRLCASTRYYAPSCPPAWCAALGLVLAAPRWYALRRCAQTRSAPR